MEYNSTGRAARPRPFRPTEAGRPKRFDGLRRVFAMAGAGDDATVGGDDNAEADSARSDGP
ncbi:hypothetical protein GCM10008992_24060 [Halorubrum aquaticum]